MTLSGLVDRERELETLRGLVEAAADGRGGLLVVGGPAGMGKTRLLDAAGELAAERGLQVLVARGSEIVALIERAGVATQSVTVARYSAPGPRRPARPRGLRVTRRRETLLVSWKGAARGFAVTVKPRGAPAILRVTRGHRVRIRGIARRTRGTVLVGGLGTGTRTGPQARRPIPRR